MTAITQLLSSQAIYDTVRAFRTAIAVENQELAEKQRKLKSYMDSPERYLLEKQVAQAKEEIFRLHFSFGQITGLAFDAELNIKKD